MNPLTKLIEVLPPAGWLKDRFSNKTPVEPKPELVVPVGHRGVTIFDDIPENTLAAHDKAWELGARCVEFDVRSANGGEFVVYHDKDLKDASGQVRNIAKMTLPDIKAIDLGGGHRIPTLQEALKNVRGRFAVDIDYKAGPETDAAMKLDALLTQEGFAEAGAPLVTIFVRRGKFEELRSLHPKFNIRPIYASRKNCRKLAEMGVKVMGLRTYYYTAAAARNIRKPGMLLFANTMPKDENQSVKMYNEYLHVGAKFIQTDDLETLVFHLRSLGKLETRVLGRDFEPLPEPPLPDPDDGPLVA